MPEPSPSLSRSHRSPSILLPEMEKNLPPTLVLSVYRRRVPMKAAAHLTPERQC